MFKEYKQCRKCYKKPGPPGLIGYYYISESKDGNVYKVVKECECHKEWAYEYERYKLFCKSGFKEDLWNYDVNEYAGTKSSANVARLQKYVDQFTDPDVRKTIQYWWGPNGTQKSTVANWVGKQLILKHENVKLITMHNLVQLCWERDNEDNGLDELSNCDMLIIDECFDKTKVYLWKSGAQLGAIDNFIRTRMYQLKGCIFISNIKLENITEHGFSESLKDLIYRETKKTNTVFEWQDRWIDEANADNMSNIFEKY